MCAAACLPLAHADSSSSRCSLVCTLSLSMDLYEASNIARQTRQTLRQQTRQTSRQRMRQTSRQQTRQTSQARL